MRRPPDGDVKKRLPPGLIAAGLLIFIMALTVLRCGARYYELRQENSALETEIAALEEDLQVLKETVPTELGKRAEEMGLHEIREADIQVLHIRETAAP